MESFRDHGGTAGERGSYYLPMAVATLATIAA
jgi:hypothetical protein